MNTEQISRLVQAAKAVVDLDSHYDKEGYHKSGLEWDCALISLALALRDDGEDA